MTAFTTDHNTIERRVRKDRREDVLENPSASSADSALNVVSALRRCRQPVPARVAVADGRPVRVTTDRRGYAGGTVTHCAGPWRTSGEWWLGGDGKLGVRSEKLEVQVQSSEFKVLSSVAGPWDRDEWDVSLSDGAVYRVFRDRDADRWFIDAVVD
jgi:hypothetical protein